MNRAIAIYVGMIQVIIGLWLMQTGQWIPFMVFIAIGLLTGFFQRIYEGARGNRNALLRPPTD